MSVINASSGQIKKTQFKKIIQFALTFHDCPVLIYNKHIISPYLLAANGFAKKNLSQSELHQGQAIIAICQHQKCRKNIKMDQQNEGYVMRDQIQFALIDHDQQCFYKSKQFKKLSETDIYEYGLEHFQQIKSTYLNNDDDHLDYLAINWKQIQEAFDLNNIGDVSVDLQLYKILDNQFSTRQKTISKNIILPLFGWKFSKDESNISLKCHYCGNCISWGILLLETRSKKIFNVMSSHHKWCLIKNYEGWRMIMKKLQHNQLNQIQGEFCKTKEEIEAKQLKEDIFQMTKKYFVLIDQVIQDNESYGKTQLQILNQNEGHHNEQARQSSLNILKQYEVKAANLNLSGKMAKDILTNFINKIKLAK